MSNTFTYRCSNCACDIDSSCRSVSGLLCPSCHTTYPKYRLGDTEIFDFIQLSSRGKCQCNRDGLTECNIDLRAETNRLSAPREVITPTNARIVKELEPLAGKGTKVLDLGCGAADYAPYIAKGNTVCGLDSRARPLLLNKQNALGKGYAALVLAEALRLPFASNEFDAILCTELIEHVFEVRLLLQEINLVLKVGGYLILTTPNLVSLWNRMSILAGIGKGLGPWGILQGKGLYDRWSSIVYPDQALHVRFFTFGSLKGLLGQMGFECQRTVGKDPLFSRLPPLDAWLKTVCSTILIKAAKVREPVASSVPR